MVRARAHRVPAGNTQTNNTIDGGSLELYNGVSNNLVADNEMTTEVRLAVRNCGPAALTPRAAQWFASGVDSNKVTGNTVGGSLDMAYGVSHPYLCLLSCVRADH